jgi:putative heme transporter
VPSRRTRSFKVPALLEWAAAMAWRLLLVAIVAYLAARLLAHLRLVVLPLLAALLLTSLLGPPVAWLRRRGWSSLVATWTVLAAALGVLAAVMFLVSYRIAPQLGDLTTHLGDSLDRIRGWLVHGPLHLSDRQLGDLTRRLQQELTANRTAIVSRVVSTTALLLQFVGGAILTVLLTFPGAHQPERPRQLSRRHRLGRLPPARRRLARRRRGRRAALHQPPARRSARLAPTAAPPGPAGRGMAPDLGR